MAGSGNPGLRNGPAATADFREPKGIALDRERNLLYVADTGNDVIRKLDLTAGIVSTFAGTPPSGGNNQGNQGNDPAGDFREPTGLALDTSGNVYVADALNHRVRRVTPTGVITTVAGKGLQGYADGAAAQALFREPRGIALASNNVLFIADTGNNAIRKIDLATGTVSTVAGTPQEGNRDGEGQQAAFNRPTGVALDEAGNLYAADANNNRLRKIDLHVTPAAVTTLTGSGKGGFLDGALTTAQFRQPAGLALEGALDIADTNNNAIRIVYPELKLTAAWPRRGPLGGANAIRLFGGGFIPGRTDVKIGSVPAASITYIAASELLVTLPPGSAGSADITVTTPAGSAALPAAYSYVSPPALTSIDPRKGKIAGGQQVTIVGTNFLDGGDTVVAIGGAEASQIVVKTPNTLTALTPAGSAGAADVTITTPGGTSTLAKGFTYFLPPVITAFAPAIGLPGTAVVISGSGFDPDPAGNTISFGALPSPVTSAAATELRSVVPPRAVTAKITITTAGGLVTSTQTFAVPVLTKVAITPARAAIEPAKSQQFTAQGIYSDGSTRDITSLASCRAQTRRSRPSARRGSQSP